MTSLLRPSQVQDFEEEKKRIEDALAGKNGAQLQDASSARKQLRNIGKILHEQAPKELVGKEKDVALKRIEILKGKIQKNMPSKEEMRKCPSGAIAKHTNWEKATKSDVNEYKELMLKTNYGTDDAEIASIEKLRPTKSTLNIHNELVEGQQFHNIENVTGGTVTFSDADLALIKQRSPEHYGKLALMDNEGRKLVRQQFLDGYTDKK